ncbi:MAG: serine O-acetyltransferase, partial [Verrucomicrobiales bacterium]
METEYSKVVPELLRSYKELGGLNKCDRTNLPSKRAIAQICEEFLTLLFPGFFDSEAVPESELEMLTMERVAAMNRELHKQVAKSFQCSRGVNDDCLKQVSAVVGSFLSALPKIRSLLKTDVDAAYEGDPAATSIEEIILSYPCIEAIAIQRLAHELYNFGVPILPRIMTEWAHSQTGIDIHPGATIGPYFFIDHGTGVVIGETCVIGSHVKLYDGITLGARSFPKDKDGRIVKGIKRHPNVEDNVTIYANAIILGGDTTIGANST